jgi:hypothetical protein
MRPSNHGLRIDDNLEQCLANRFASVIIIESDESNYPVSVEWFLSHAILAYHEDCFLDENHDVGGAPDPLMTQGCLLGRPGQPPWLEHKDYGEDDSGYCDPRHRDITCSQAPASAEGKPDRRTAALYLETSHRTPELRNPSHLQDSITAE